MKLSVALILLPLMTFGLAVLMGFGMAVTSVPVILLVASVAAVICAVKVIAYAERHPKRTVPKK